MYFGEGIGDFGRGLTVVLSVLVLRFQLEAGISRSNGAMGKDFMRCRSIVGGIASSVDKIRRDAVESMSSKFCLVQTCHVC